VGLFSVSTSPSTLTDLVKAARHGQEGAFEDLVQRFQGYGLGLAAAWLGDPDLARDAVQEAFLDVHLHLAALQRPEAFASWFRRIVIKHCDRLTRRSRPMGRLNDEADLLADIQPAPITDERHGDAGREVRRALEELPPSQRVVIALQYFGGCSQPEIAQLLGLPLTTIKKRAHDARVRLKGVLEHVEATLQGQAEAAKRDVPDAIALFLAIRNGNAKAVAKLL
jgi:RNA polymerase sigma-70 factor (ECF subfamily)